MNTDTETPLPFTTTEPKKKLGRPSRTAAETQKQKIERLQTELKEAQEALRANEEKRALIVGHASLRHARHNTEFARMLASALRTEIRSKVDRMAIRDLIDDPATPRNPS